MNNVSPCVKQSPDLGEEQERNTPQMSFGLKEFTLAESTNCYVLDISVYTDKENAADSMGLPKHVLKLLEADYGLGCNIFITTHL